MDAAVVSKYGLRVESKQYDSYYEARQEGSNCSDGSIVAGDPRHTACLRFGDAQDVYGNSEYAHVLKPAQARAAAHALGGEGARGVARQVVLLEHLLRGGARARAIPW